MWRGERNSGLVMMLQCKECYLQSRDEHWRRRYKGQGAKGKSQAPPLRDADPKIRLKESGSRGGGGSGGNKDGAKRLIFRASGKGQKKKKQRKSKTGLVPRPARKRMPV